MNAVSDNKDCEDNKIATFSVLFRMTAEFDSLGIWRQALIEDNRKVQVDVSVNSTAYTQLGIPVPAAVNLSTVYFLGDRGAQLCVSGQWLTRKQV